MSLAIIVGIGIIAACLFYLSFNIEQNKHVILQLFFMGMGILMLLLLAKASLDSAQVCDYVIQDQTLNSTTNITIYTHILQCTQNNTETPTTLYTIMLWIVRLFFAYVIIYFLIEALTYLTQVGK